MDIHIVTSRVLNHLVIDLHIYIDVHVRIHIRILVDIDIEKCCVIGIDIEKKVLCCRG